MKMNKGEKLLLLYILVIIYIPIRGIKNIKGDIYGELICPNCFDSLTWKPSGTLIYWKAEKEPAFGISSMGIDICQECLNHPKKLHANRIGLVLFFWGWDQQNIKLVKKAVYKKQHPLPQEEQFDFKKIATL